MNESQANLAEPGSETVFNSLMLWAALRCGLQYVILPFLLPLIRLSELTSVWLNIGIGLFAIAMIGWNVFRLGNTSWRKRYLIWSLIAMSIIAVFLISDIRVLLSQ